MHYHCEIIMPPTSDVERQIENIMKPFSENAEPDDRMGPSFWDWYQIGGRWSGSKLQSALDADKIAKFHEELNARKVTVSGLIWGKQELSPASQIEMVDALWREWFPESGLTACPLFKHAGDQLPDDVSTLGKTPLTLTSERVIIAGPSWKDDGTFQAKSMEQEDCWNGVQHCKTDWDGTLRQALERHAERIDRYRPDYREKHVVGSDWLVVTVDYHN